MPVHSIFSKSDEEVVDLDDILSEINEAEDLDIVSNIHHNIKCHVTKESQDLIRVQQESFELNDELNSDKSFISEVVQLEENEQQSCSELRTMIGDGREQLVNLHATEVNCVEQFENAALKSSKDLMNLPKCFESEQLLLKVGEILKELEAHSAELYQYRQELKVAENNLNTHLTGGDEGYVNDSSAIFEEGISSADELNKTLVKSVKEIECKTTAMGYKFDALKIQEE